MRVLRTFCGLFLVIAIANCNPVDKKEGEEDLSPLNEVSSLLYFSYLKCRSNKIKNITHKNIKCSLISNHAYIKKVIRRTTYLKSYLESKRTKWKESRDRALMK